MEGEWSCYGGGQFKGGRMVMLQRWALMEGEWSFYRGGQFNGGRIDMVLILSFLRVSLMEGERSC